MMMPDVGVPQLTVMQANDYARAFANRVGGSLTEPAVDVLVYLPFFLSAKPARPTAPAPWGDGALCVDLGPQDDDSWSNFVAHAGADDGLLDFELAAAAAQEWRLAVTPYREPEDVACVRQRDLRLGADFEQVSLKGVRVLDLTSMWAGPLCTALLAAAGATVIKVEPIRRPDGLRFGDGDSGLGQAPMFRALNNRKVLAPWDLERIEDRRTFRLEVARCDLVVNSFSPRVLPNLEITHEELAATNPSIRSLSITAFAAGTPEADWVAYGPGVHAATGLGWDGERHHAPSLSYPDPLAGLLAASVAVDQLAGRAPANERVSLAEAVAPLASAGHPFRAVPTDALNELWSDEPGPGLVDPVSLS